METKTAPVLGQESQTAPAPAGETGTKADRRRGLRQELTGLCALLLALFVFVWFAQRVLTPKRLDYGATWDMYLKEPENTVDALFFGTSLAYCDIVPAVLYDETGVTSYVMAGPEQTLPVTYRYVLESCRTQTPRTIFVEATYLLMGKNNRSLKVNLTYMPFGENRLRATWEEAGPKELPGLLFPLYAYHDRWDDLTLQDLRMAVTGYEADPLAGYTFLSVTRPQEETTLREFPDAETNYGRNLEYAGKIADFCRENGIRLVFFLSPGLERVSPEQADVLAADLTALGADFVNFNDDFDAIGLDPQTDFYDARHTNAWGAEKFSRYLGDRLGDWGVAPGGRGDPAQWQDRVAHFQALLAQAAAAREGGGAG